MAYKVFTNGSVLNASEVNDNLMNQAVITFTNSTARASAITSPVEGMVTYLADTDTYQFWNGSAWTNLVSSTVGTGNAVINGAFEINQRNFTSTTSGGYNFDRWTSFTQTGTTTFSSQAFTLGSAPVAGIEARNYLRLLTSGQSGTNAVSQAITRIESVRTFANQTVTISFYARAASGTPKIGVELSQVFGSGGSPSTQVNIPVSAITIGTDWTRYSATIAVPTIAGKTIGTDNNDSLALQLWVSAGTDFDTRASSIGVQNNTFDIWGVQVEAGSTATPFRRNANSIEGELAACQRYYWRSSSSNFGTIGVGVATSGTRGDIHISYPTSMRTGAFSTDIASIALTDGTNVYAITSVGINSANTNSLFLICNVASGLTSTRPYMLATNGTPGFLGISAEL